LLLGVGKLGIEIQKVFNLLFDQSQVNLQRDAPLLLAFTHAKDCTSGLMSGRQVVFQAAHHAAVLPAPTHPEAAEGGLGTARSQVDGLGARLHPSS
jgi:hypothetical protein